MNCSNNAFLGYDWRSSQWIFHFIHRRKKYMMGILNMKFISFLRYLLAIRYLISPNQGRTLARRCRNIIVYYSVLFHVKSLQIILNFGYNPRSWWDISSNTGFRWCLQCTWNHGKLGDEVSQNTVQIFHSQLVRKKKKGPRLRCLVQYIAYHLRYLYATLTCLCFESCS